MISSATVSGLLLIFLAALAQRPVGEPPIGTRIPRPLQEEEKMSEASRRTAFTVVQKMGGCLVKADPRNSMALLSTVPGSAPGHKALDVLRPRFSKCLITATNGLNLYGLVKLEMKESVLRGGVADALYRLQFAEQSPNTGRGPYLVSPIMSADIANDPAAREFVIAYAFTQCVVNAEPAAVHDFVLSKTGSVEEQGALSRLMPAMAPCVSSGTTIKTDRNSLRFLMAESLYRWAITANQLAPKGTSR